MTSTLRVRLLQIHRWTGLSVGLLLLFLAVTGLGLQFRHQLQPLAEPTTTRVASCERPTELDDQIAAARAAHASGKLESVILGEERGAPTQVRFSDDATLFVDPCSAQVVQQQARWGGLFGRLEQLHRFRFLEDNDVANAITGGTAIVMAVLLVGFGLALWWPSSLRWLKTSATLRPGLKGRAFDLNLHRTVGLYASVLLLAVAITSLPLAFKWVRQSINVAVGSPPPPAKPKSAEPPPGAKPLTMGALWERAQAVLDHPTKAVISLAKTKNDAVEIYAIEQGASHAEARSYVYLDAYSGKVLRFEPYAASSLGNRIYRTSAAIHAGEFGVLLQLLQFFGTLAIPVMGYSGISSFVRSRRSTRVEAGSFQVEVASVRDEAIGIKSFELTGLGGKGLPAFTPGAHINVHVDHETVRQYSLCNDPDRRGRYRIAVRRAPDSRGGSQALHERVQVGDRLVIEAPRNHFPLERGARHHVLVAAGIGVTPLIGMAQALQRQGKSYELHYFTRSIEHAAFHDELSQPRFNGRVNFHYAVEPERLRELLRRVLAERPEGHHLYLCGPRRFMEVVEETVAGRWPAESIHVEHFSADPQAQAGPCVPFEVHLQRSQRTLDVPANKSIADVLCHHGINVVTSCRQGVCGTCLTGVIAGNCDHRDAFLSDKERKAGDKIMVCVSRARGDQIVLDL
jgi:ferredoxin-NADP reductase